MDPTPDRDDDELNTLRRTLLALLPGLALADTATAQDAARAQPQSYRIAFENDKLRALEYRSRPGMGVCGEGMHSHPAHLTVVLSTGKVRVKTPDGKVVVADGKLGDVFWSEAETHEVENLSGRDSRALLIELKPAAGKA
jgi:beta-alanine degradation protein BauB